MLFLINAIRILLITCINMCKIYKEAAYVYYAAYIKNTFPILQFAVDPKRAILTKILLENVGERMFIFSFLGPKKSNQN